MKNPPTTAQGLQAQFSSGERVFSSVDFYRSPKLTEPNDGRRRLVNFSSAQLKGVRFENSNFMFSDFSFANLESCRIIRCSFDDTYLESADLSNSVLQQTRFARNRFNDTSLRNALIVGCDFSGAYLSGSDWRGAVIGEDYFIDVDLGPLCGADPPVKHVMPSTVDVRTILRSIQEPNLEAFLLASGMPELFVSDNLDCARTLDHTGRFKLLQSTFVSYGGPDEVFAKTLHQALQRNGVQTFFFPVDAVPGQKLHRIMRDGVNSYDRVILICSESSLQRPGVLNEIQETLQREAREGGKEFLIPIAIDDYVYHEWAPADPYVAMTVRDRVIGDFRGAATNKAVFGRELVKLLGALRK